VTRGDRFVVVAVALLAVLAWPATLLATAGRTDSVVVTGPSGTSRLAMTPDRSLSVDGLRGPVHLDLRGGAVRVIASPCPDQLCVHQGAVSRSGAAIVCVPSGIAVRIGGGDDALDAVVR
jgi:hypothetical protein